MNLLQLMFMVLIIALMSVIGVNWHAGNSHEAVYSTRDLNSTLTAASSTASQTSDGATVSFARAGKGSLITIYAGRPDVSTTPPTSSKYPTTAPIALADGTTSFSLVLAHDGSATLLRGWTPWSQISSATTACATVGLLIGATGAQRAVTLSCSTLSVQ